jgi:hypothetical protein
MTYHTTSATIVGRVIGTTWGGFIAQQDRSIALPLWRIARQSVQSALATALATAGDFQPGAQWSADTELHVTRRRYTATGYHSHVRIVPLMAQRYAAHPITMGFIEAMEFTDCSAYNGDECADKPFSPNLTTAIGQYCGRFIVEHNDQLDGLSDETLQRIGNDLWFTQAGHGVGFWERDRRAMYGVEQANEWDEWSKANRFGDIYLGDNGMVYHG